MGLVDQVLRQCARGNAAKASTSAFAVSISGPVLGQRAAPRNIDRTRSSRSGAGGAGSPLHETVGASANSRQRSSPTCLPSHVTDGRVASSQVSETDSGIREVMVMRVFVASGTGVIGRRLVPQLAARGHHK